MTDERPIAVEIDRVSFAYEGAEDRVVALDDVSLKVREGERLGILGPNGGGKTTLLKLMLGELEPDLGAVRVFGRSAKDARREGLVGWLPQRLGADLAWPLSVRQVVELGITVRLGPFTRLSPEDRMRVDSALELVGMLDKQDRPIGGLSGGQVQRVMIARAIAPRPRLLVLDEPTLGVDVRGQRLFAEMIETLQRELGLTVVIVTHELRTIAASAERVACLSRRLHFHDAPQGLTPGVLAQVFAHDVEGIFGEVHVDAHSAEDCDDPGHTHDHGCGCDHGGNP
jgi:zinc transport system ATP-binding protein